MADNLTISQKRAFKYANDLQEFLVIEDDYVHKAELNKIPDSSTEKGVVPACDVSEIIERYSAYKNQSPRVAGTLDDIPNVKQGGNRFFSWK